MINNFTRLLISFCFVSLLAFASSAHSYEAELHSLAGKLLLQLEAAGQKNGTVIDFTDLQGASTELGRFLAQELSDQLVTGGKKVSFVDRTNLQVLLRENKLSMEGLVNPESSRKLGNLIGIDTVILGTTTPLSDKIRLSVRAVAVETGKIVASQATNLPAISGLGDLYNRGVATSAAEGMKSSGNAQPDPRARFRADSIKVSASEAIIGGNGWYTGSVTFNLKNLSGIGFGSAIRVGATSIGGCVGSEQQSSGLGLINDQTLKDLSSAENPDQKLRYIPVNGDISVTIIMGNCQPGNFTGVKSTNVSMSLVIASGKNIMVIPLSASNVPVRMGPAT